MKRFAIKGNILFSSTKDKIEEHPDSYLICTHGYCQGVYKELPEEFRGIPVEDYGTCLIIPGLVDLHIHAPQYAYRGMGMDLELMDWLQKQAFPEEAKYADIEYAKAAYTLFAGNMLHSTGGQLNC